MGLMGWCAPLGAAVLSRDESSCDDHLAHDQRFAIEPTMRPKKDREHIGAPQLCPSDAQGTPIPAIVSA